MDDSFNWNKVIKKEAKSNDNKELGEIQGTEYNCLVVERGLVNILDVKKRKFMLKE
jgi:hypothetical protein